jgi:tagaturonate epimerase
MRAVNRFLLENNLRISNNPCISPDFCLDWEALSARLTSTTVRERPNTRFETAAGRWTLLEDETTCDCAWKLEPREQGTGRDALAEGVALGGGATAFPATWENLLRLKNAVQEHDPGSTIFPTASGNLGRSTLGIGARFTTLHWPAVEWAMHALNLGVTANQNSIPRELVFDVDVMLEGRLDTVPFPFIGTNVPEGHQGQSVEGMSHGCVLSKLKTGFHRRRIAWSFNADHQPIGGKFDAREDALVRGCVLASYITFDLSPELAQTRPASDAASWVKANVPSDLVDRVRARVASVGLTLDASEFSKLLAYVWPALEKMKRRDDKYRAAREKAFTTETGREYLRELSIDELPGLTAPETTAAMLSLCEALDMRINFVAPAFGFQKNTPYPDNAALRELIEKQWTVCRAFQSSIGFHSGSGKSAENYQVMGSVTNGNLEIKTSGRYTYEMGVALSASKNAADAALWRDWYIFTVDMAIAGAFSNDATEQKMARGFVTSSLASATPRPPGNPFDSPSSCRRALEALPPSPDYMFFSEYNFLYVMAAGGRPDKTSLGDHSPAGYAQRARFYSISAEARLNYAKAVAHYIIFLAATTGLVEANRCATAAARLDRYTSLEEMVAEI